MLNQAADIFIHFMLLSPPALPICFSYSKVGDNRAHDPPNWVAETYGVLVEGDLCHKEQIDLPADNEAEEHDAHRTLRVTGAS